MDPKDEGKTVVSYATKKSFIFLKFQITESYAPWSVFAQLSFLFFNKLSRSVVLNSINWQVSSSSFKLVWINFKFFVTQLTDILA